MGLLRFCKRFWIFPLSVHTSLPEITMLTGKVRRVKLGVCPGNKRLPRHQYVLENQQLNNSVGTQNA